MRFKKLKISIAIALVAFIFIVGNVIVFGMIKSKATVQDTSKIADIAVPTVPENKPAAVQQPAPKKVTAVSSTTTSSGSASQDSNTAPQPVIITHTRTRTRAS